MTRDKFKEFFKSISGCKVGKLECFTATLSRLHTVSKPGELQPKHRGRFLACQPELQGRFASHIPIFSHSHIPTSPEPAEPLAAVWCFPRYPFSSCFLLQCTQCLPCAPGSSEPPWVTGGCCCDPIIQNGTRLWNCKGGVWRAAGEHCSRPQLFCAIREAAAKHMDLYLANPWGSGDVQPVPSQVMPFVCGSSSKDLYWGSICLSCLMEKHAQDLSSFTGSSDITCISSFHANTSHNTTKQPDLSKGVSIWHKRNAHFTEEYIFNIQDLCGLALLFSWVHILNHAWKDWPFAEET